MRNLLSTVLLLAATLAASAQNDLKSVLSQLDATLSHRDSYIAGREQRIESLKNILRKSDFSDAQRYILNQQLIDEYTPYQADSTIDYLYRNIALASTHERRGAPQPRAVSSWPTCTVRRVSTSKRRTC